LKPTPELLHAIFEALAYIVGILLAILYKRRRPVPLLISKSDWQYILCGALVGGIVGSKVVAWFFDIDALQREWWTLDYWLRGKTVVGGLLGATLGVEATKKVLGVTVSTGDALVMPLVIGMIIGRIGCFLGGMTDNTFGTVTSATFPLAWDFGDGLPRHPTQLYEIAFLVAIGLLLHSIRIASLAPGDRFKIFMVTYFLFRLVIDEWKPYPDVLIGLNAIQVTAVLGLLYYARDIARAMKGAKAWACGDVAGTTLK